MIDLFKREFERRNCDPVEVVTEWCSLLSDQIMEQEGNSDLEDEDDQGKVRTYHIHKYIPQDGRLIESVIVAGQPCFIQMKDGLDFDILPEFRPQDNIVLKPQDRFSDLSYNAYIFDSKEEIGDN